MFFSGSVIERVTDLRLGGPAFDWTFTRSYDSVVTTYSSGEVQTALGDRWHGPTRGPYLVSHNYHVDVVDSGSSNRTFQPSGYDFLPPADYNAELIRSNYDTSDETFTLTEYDTGNIYIFYGFYSGISDYHKGRLKERTTRAYQALGRTGTTYAYPTSGVGAGYVSVVTPPESIDYQIRFTYDMDADEYGRLQKVEIVFDPGGGGETVIAKAEYTYYGDLSGSPTHLGSIGDLIQVKVSKLASNGTDWIVRYTQYRYYVDGGSDPGEAHQLKMVLESDAIERIIADNSNIDTPEDVLAEVDSYSTGSTLSKTIEQFASRTFTYYVKIYGGFDNTVDTLSNSSGSFTSSWGTTENFYNQYGSTDYDESYNPLLNGPGMVKSETINGACSSCGGSVSGGVKREYYYANMNGGFYTGSKETELNYTAFLIVEDTIANSTAQYRKVRAVNYHGQVLREAFLTNPLSVSSSNVWCESIRLDDSTWKVTQKRLPSAHAGEVTSSSELTQFLDPFTPGTPDDWSNDEATVSSTAGVVYHYVYDNGSGIRQYDLKVSQGRTGTAYYVSAKTYGDADNDNEGADKDNPTLVTTEYSYPTQTTTRTAGIPTTYAYTFWDTADTSVKTKTTTLPAIDDVTQNGSDVATTTAEYFDEAGRLRWTKDGEGFVNYYSYHPENGQIAYMMVDVDSTSDPTGSEIENGSSGKWMAWTVDDADGNKPTRGSGLPTAVTLVTKHEFDTQGRGTLTIEPSGTKHYSVYGAFETLRFPYFDATTDRPLVPIERSVMNGAGQVTEVIQLDPAYTVASNDVPTGISGYSQSNYVTYTINNYDPLLGRLSEMRRYHDVSGNTAFTNFYSTTYLYDDLGRRAATIQGVASGKYQVDVQMFDKLDRVIETRRGVASVAPTSYSALNVEDATPPLANPSNFDGYAKLSTTTYDSGGVGDSHATSMKGYFGTTSTEFIETLYKLTYRGHIRGIERKNNTTAFSPYSIRDIDWLGRTTGTAEYASAPTWPTDYTGYISGSSGRNFWTKTNYDDLGRAFRTEKYPGTETSNRFEINNYYDRNNRLVATGQKYSAHMEYAYDGAGRQYQSRTVLSLETTKYSSGAFDYVEPAPDRSFGSMTSGDDGLIEFSHTVFDSSGNPIEEHHFECFHNDTNGIDLSNDDDYVRGSMFYWYDGADRVTAMADYGSGDTASGAGSWKYVATPPSRPGTALTWTDSTVYNGLALLTKYGYHSANGRQETVTRGVNEQDSDTYVTTTKTYSDELGRRTYVSEDWDGSGNADAPTVYAPASDGDNRITKFVYNGLNNLTELIAYNQSSTADETTKYLYEDDYNASLVTNTIYPDSSDTTSSGTDQLAMEYSLDGSITKRKGQGSTENARVIHEYTYNNRRQVELDKVTQLYVNTDGHVRAIKREYDSMGRIEKVTSTENSDGTGTVRNQVKYTYNWAGRLSKIEQSHENAVTTGTPAVEFTYDATETSSVYNDNFRVTSVAYPSFGSLTGMGLNYWFGSDDSVTDKLSRSAYEKLIEGALQSGTNYHTTWYYYNGTSRLARLYTEQTNIKRDMFTSGTNDYSSFDRFGRVVKHAWGKDSTSYLWDETKYTLDYIGNRTTRDVTTTLGSGTYSDTRDQSYVNDRLLRLDEMEQGTLSSGSITSRNEQQDWGLDHLGNWASFKERDTDTGSNWDLEQTRTHNDANEITDLDTTTGTAWSDQIFFDPAGNMYYAPKPGAESANDGVQQIYTFDAWNRLVKVEEWTYIGGQPGATSDVASYEYDGLGQRIRKDIPGGSTDDRDYYYNENWQLVLELEPTEIDAVAIYHWHPFYIDALACRMRAGDTHFFLHDANFNVTAAVEDSSNNVIERYAYTPYGQVTVLDNNFDEDSNNLSDIDNQHLYTGRERDPETRLQLNRNRYYHPTLGRWLSRDPVEYDDGTNLYFAYFVPNGLDPSGLRSIDDIVRSQGASGSHCIGWTIPLPVGASLNIEVCLEATIGTCCDGEYWQEFFEISVSAEGYVEIGKSIDIGGPRRREPGRPSKKPPGKASDDVPHPCKFGKKIKRRNYQRELNKCRNFGGSEEGPQGGFGGSTGSCPDPGWNNFEGEWFVRGTAGAGFGFYGDVTGPLFPDDDLGSTINGSLGFGWIGRVGASLEVGVSATGEYVKFGKMLDSCCEK